MDYHQGRGGCIIAPMRWDAWFWMSRAPSSKMDTWTSTNSMVSLSEALLGDIKMATRAMGEGGRCEWFVLGLVCCVVGAVRVKNPSGRADFLLAHQLKIPSYHLCSKCWVRFDNKVQISVVDKKVHISKTSPLYVGICKNIPVKTIWTFLSTPEIWIFLSIVKKEDLLAQALVI